ncbi:hypothetical protein ACHAWT_001511 [Skeletonema menzelii]
MIDRYFPFIRRRQMLLSSLMSLLSLQPSKDRCRCCNFRCCFLPYSLLPVRRQMSRLALCNFRCCYSLFTLPKTDVQLTLSNVAALLLI